VSRRAFTLIEVMLVVLLVVILAGAAAMSFARPLRAARAREAIEQIRAFDAAARQVARRSGREVEIVLDAYRQELVRREQGRDVSQVRLPNGLRIDQVRTSGDAREGLDLSLSVSPHGWSRSYAMRLVGLEFDGWLLVAGMSGQVTVIEDESRVLDILTRADAAARRDAD
jgi:prepilin-type N-terminal cleavage/methylation domain-containing protein